MDAYKAIVSKRDTRAYLDRPIDDDTLRKVLQAGRMAGSSKNTQPCRLVVLRDKEWKKEVASCGRFSEPLVAAQVGIAICCAPIGTTKEDFDAGRAAQNMMLAAWNEGIASCPVSMHDQECITSKLGLPEGFRVPVVIALGYPEPSAPMGLGKQRLPLEEYVRWERWE